GNALLVHKPISRGIGQKAMHWEVRLEELESSQEGNCDYRRDRNRSWSAVGWGGIRRCQRTAYGAHQSVGEHRWLPDHIFDLHTEVRVGDCTGGLVPGQRGGCGCRVQL